MTRKYEYSTPPINVLATALVIVKMGNQEKRLVLTYYQRHGGLWPQFGHLSENVRDLYNNVARLNVVRRECETIFGEKKDSEWFFNVIKFSSENLLVTHRTVLLFCLL